MDNALLKSLANFFLDAIPTAIFFLLLYAAYRFILHNPLKKVLAERYERTQGAMAKAKADIAAAHSKTQEYEQKLREARMAIFKAQESRRQQLTEIRETALGEARNRAQALVKDARASLEKDAAQARAQLQQQAEALANEVVRMVLRPLAAAPSGGAR
jgi:F-type H+-transporting ATPase subunit b